MIASQPKNQIESSKETERRETETYFDDPWPHSVIDNFFDPDLLRNLEIEFKNHLEFKKNDSWAESMEISRLVYNTRNPQFESAFPHATKCLTSVDYSRFLATFREKRPHSELTICHELSYLNHKYAYPIHDEAAHKIISLVAYVAPDEGQGTLLYDKDKNFVKQVPWRRNRVLAFAGISGLTWHSYETDQKPRLTINTFLETP